MIGEGRSINVTLIFSLERYGEVMEAYLAGLEDAVAGGARDLSGVRSVASFFVSRVDTEVDRRLETAAGSAEGTARQALLDARGTAAVAQAQQAYQRFRAVFAGPRWEALAAQGAKVQRPLWASTSTKNPAYPDLLYVDSLIGPDTVNTMPDETIAALPRPRRGGPDRRRRARRFTARPRAPRGGRDRHGRRGPDPRGRRGGQLRQVLRRAHAVAHRQGHHPGGGNLTLEVPDR